MGRRWLIGRHGRTFVIRSGGGRFIKFTNKGKSLRADRRKKAKTKVRSGYGHRGDQ